jgi:hypothetical protein
LVHEILYYAHDYERTEARSIAVLLDEFDRVNTISIDGNWAGIYLGGQDNSCTFLAQAIEAGLRIYVKEKLELNGMLITQKIGRPLLDYACSPTILWIDAEIPDPQMVRLLLEHVSDPNQPVGGTAEGDTVWGLFVFRCYSREVLDEPLENKWYEITKLMIDHGASRDLKIQIVDGTGEEVPVLVEGTAPGTRQGTVLSLQTMLESIFGVDRAARLTSRMEEYAQRHAPPPPPRSPPPSLFWRLLGWI